MSLWEVIRNSFIKLIFGFVILYIPLWIGISLIWQSFDSNNVGLRDYLIIQILVLLCYVFIAFQYIINPKLEKKMKDVKYKPRVFPKIHIPFSRIKKYIQLKFSKGDPQTVLVTGYGQVRPCCYNAARLGDMYCMCGRGIPDNLRNYFNSATV